MIRERTSQNLAIGLALSLLLHIIVVTWAPPLTLDAPSRRSASEVEVQLREWPAPPTPSPPIEAMRVEEPTPSEPIRVPAAKPSLPPDVKALQDAVLASVQAERPEMPAPDHPPALPTFDSPLEPVQLPQVLRDPVQSELRIADLPTLPDLPTPERTRAEPQLPALPELPRDARRDKPAAHPATITLPVPRGTSPITGPAAERQVIFQPPLPSVTVDSETELELRFWILPNGAVGRIVPVKKADPRLEALAISYLRYWRFTPLPSEAPQDEQWGIIPFKFRIR